MDANDRVRVSSDRVAVHERLPDKCCFLEDDQAARPDRRTEKRRRSSVTSRLWRRTTTEKTRAIHPSIQSPPWPPLVVVLESSGRGGDMKRPHDYSSPVAVLESSGRGEDMKRPHNYSSPDTDADELIDVGQEDSYW